MHRHSLPHSETGSELLLERWSPLSRPRDARQPAASRLERELGTELARRLVVALATRRSDREGAG